MNLFYKYHFFIIWPNGLSNSEKIIDIIKNSNGIELVSIQKYKLNNMRSFLNKLYSIDNVPNKHLKNKLSYLYKLDTDIINIFVKNYLPQEVFVGEKLYRKKQCQTIVNIKNNIRNEFNPKHHDPDFCVPPLKRGVSHEHVIHGSDSEADVDYYLKMIGIKNGIKYLENDNYGFPFSKPYYIRRPSKYIYKYLPISSLLANILEIKNNRVTTKKVKLDKTPHYKSLVEESAIYNKYINTFRYTYLCDNYSLDNYNKMKNLLKDPTFEFPPILVKPDEENFLILDGVHRSAISLYNKRKLISSVVIINEYKY